MIRQGNRFSVVVTVALFVFGSSSSTLGRGSLAIEDSWNAAHLENLPPEIRARVQKWDLACGGSLAAAHLFARHLAIPGIRFLSLHFEDLRCANRSALCNDRGCLHEVYASAGSHYRLVLSVHAHEIRMTRNGDAAGIEIDDGASAPSILRWNGGRFSRLDADKKTNVKRSKTGTHNE